MRDAFAGFCDQFLLLVREERRALLHRRHLFSQHLVELAQHLVGIVGDAADVAHFIGHVGSRAVVVTGDKAIGRLDERCFRFLRPWLCNRCRHGFFDLGGAAIDRRRQLRRFLPDEIGGFGKGRFRTAEIGAEHVALRRKSLRGRGDLLYGLERELREAVELVLQRRLDLFDARAGLGERVTAVLVGIENSIA